MVLRTLVKALCLCACASFSVSFSPAGVPTPRLRSGNVACSAERRAFLALGGGLAGSFVLGGARVDPVRAMSFEEFMAQKRKDEAMDAARKSGLPVVEPEVSAEESSEETAAPTPSEPRISAMDEYKDIKPKVDPDPFKTSLVTILRVQESTLQQERLIRTGQFKDLQRNNIKLATRMVLENSGINDAITRASKFAKNNKISEANEMGRDAIEDLQTILNYFDESSMKVSDLSEDKKKFVTKALTASRQKLDKFLSYMPVEKVSAARAQVIEENELNLKEMPKDLPILNPVFMN
mmetsp:Transcript_61597/g.151619  ORF Transcript_61597/g.151619 Transcript_61597/m.151619 type:complete len:294 (+) Transcript_61597:37-918(+)